MSLAGLADAVLADPTLATAVADARAGTLPALDLTGPAALRPFVVTGLVDAGRTVLAVTPTAREAEDLVESLGDLIDPDLVGYYPSWETLPHERLSPRSDTVGRRLAVLRRLRHPGTDATNGPLKVVVAPVRSVLQPQVKGLGDLEPVELAAGRHRAARGRRTPARRRGVLPRRPGRAARRVRRARRHRRRLPADRGAPAARGVLGRRRRGDPHASRSPTSAPSTRSTGSGRRRAASCCSPTRYAARAAELGEQPPAAARDHRQDRRGHRGRGHGVAGAGARRRDGAAGRPAARRHPRAGARPRAGAVARPRPGRHQRGVPGRELGGRGRRRQAPIDLGAASYRSLGDVRAHTLGQGKPWWTISPFGLGGDDGRPTPTVARRCATITGEIVSSGVDVSVGAVESRLLPGPTGRVLPRRHRAGGRRRPAVAQGGLPRRRGPPRPRPGPADGRGARASTTWPPGWSRTSPTAAAHRPGHRHLRRARPTASSTRPTGVVLLTGEDLSGQKASTRDMRRMPARRKRQIDPLELTAGDYVVHEQHGVGRYVEMKQREVGGATREYLVLEYGASKRGGPPDRLYVPTDALDQVTRYVGGEQPQPRPARRRRLGQAQGPGPQGGPRDRGRADQAVRRPAGHQGPRVRPGHARGSASSRTPSRSTRPPTS